MKLLIPLPNNYKNSFCVHIWRMSHDNVNGKEWDTGMLIFKVDPGISQNALSHLNILISIYSLYLSLLVRTHSLVAPLKALRTFILGVEVNIEVCPSPSSCFFTLWWHYFKTPLPTVPSLLIFKSLAWIFFLNRQKQTEL